MFKKIDYIIISLICVFLGVFFVSQIYAARQYQAVVTPENDKILSIEVARMTKTNADLRQEVKKLTSDLDTYKSLSDTGDKLAQKYKSDSEKLDILNGILPVEGEGVTVKVTGGMSTPQIVDLVNAIKNIGSALISINDSRIVLDTDFYQFAGKGQYEIKILGNRKLLKTAMERKGGIVEQISTKDLKISVEEVEKLSLPKTEEKLFIYSRILLN